MIYEISSSIYKTVRASFNDKVEANNEEEAKEIAEKLIDKLVADAKEDLSNAVIDRPNAYVKLSDDNFKLKRGGIYLVRRYKSYVPAVVYNSFSYSDFRHELKYLNSGKFFVLKGKNPERVGEKLCDDGSIINKPECAACVARFWCFTNKGCI